jgi:hypothetical protein
MQKIVDDVGYLQAKIEEIKERSKEYEWTIKAPKCSGCDDLLYKFVDDTDAVIPCSACNRDLYDRWRSGEVNSDVRRRVTQGVERKVRNTDDGDEKRRKDLF